MPERKSRSESATYLGPKLTTRNFIHKTIRYCSIGKPGLGRGFKRESSVKYWIENKE